MQRRRDAVRLPHVRPDRRGERDRVAAAPTPSRSSVARRNPSFDDGSAGPPREQLGDTNRGYAGPPSNYATPAPYSSPQGYSAPQPYTTGSSTGTGDRYANARDYVPPAPSADPAPGADRYAGRTMDRARAAARGETIQVQQGDTLYGIARRYGVSVAALIEINGLAHGSAIKPGQQLVLPAGVPATVAAESPASRAAGSQYAATAGRRRNAGGARRMGGSPHLEAG